jgi:GcrA cell cycle regulator
MSVWKNEDLVDQLKLLWSKGYSALQVAGMLNSGVHAPKSTQITRNAVISKVHRLRLSKRVAGRQPGQPQTRMVPKKKKSPPPQTKIRAVICSLPQFPAEPYDPEMDIEVPMHLRRGIGELKEGQCNWPIGDPGHEGFHWCHMTKVAGLPYCEQHTRRAHQPPPARVKPVIRVTDGRIAEVQAKVRENETAAGEPVEAEREDA